MPRPRQRDESIPTLHGETSVDWLSVSMTQTIFRYG